jgi:alpha-ketoglutarate-dependent taurine dioxygenase
MTTRHLKVEPLPNATFGAAITGIDLTNLSSALWVVVESAFNEHGMLIFPEQQLAADTQATFAKRFGSLQGGRPKGDDRARSISNRGSDKTVLTEQDPTWLTLSYPTRYWHLDGTFAPVPPKICMLSAVSVASRGGQTGFADMSAGYDALDQDTKDRIADLNAYHSNLLGTTRVLPKPNREYLRTLVGDAPQDGYYGLRFSAECPLRPLVKYHPITNRPSLFIGRHAFGIPGMSLEASERFLNDLETFACQPPRVYEHTWQIGDLIVFDNRRLLHRACPYDEQGETRELLNCRIAGDAQTDAGLATEEAQQSAEVQHTELVRLHSRKAS